MLLTLIFGIIGIGCCYLSEGHVQASLSQGGTVLLDSPVVFLNVVAINSIQVADIGSDHDGVFNIDLFVAVVDFGETAVTLCRNCVGKLLSEKLHTHPRWCW
jgi:hypothetical protein